MQFLPTGNYSQIFIMSLGHLKFIALYSCIVTLFSQIRIFHYITLYAHVAEFRSTIVMLKLYIRFIFFNEIYDYLKTMDLGVIFLSPHDLSL